MQLERFSTNENVFSLRKRRLSLFIQSQPIKESFFCQHTTATISHRTQTNVPQPFSNVACRCELAAKQPIFETLQSCISRKITLSHRFKSSPAIPGNFAISGTAGYMMNAGHFSESHVSSGDLNRSPESRGSQTSGVLLVLFVHAKSTQNVPFAGNFEVLQTSKQRTAAAASRRNN